MHFVFHHSIPFLIQQFDSDFNRERYLLKFHAADRDDKTEKAFSIIFWIIFLSLYFSASFDFIFLVQQ